jgi:hypothetical protein
VYAVKFVLRSASQLVVVVIGVALVVALVVVLVVVLVVGNLILKIDPSSGNENPST